MEAGNYQYLIRMGLKRVIPLAVGENIILFDYFGLTMFDFTHKLRTLFSYLYSQFIAPSKCSSVIPRVAFGGYSLTLSIIFTKVKS